MCEKWFLLYFIDNLAVTERGFWKDGVHIAESGKGDKIVFIREGLITKKLENLEAKLSETICLELTVCNKIWFILFAYRPPQENNKYVFFNELNIKHLPKQ